MSLETAIAAVNRVYREFRRYTGDGLPGEPSNAPLPVGDPSSGVHNPKKSDIRSVWIEPVELAMDAADRAEAAAALAGPTSVYAGTFTPDGVETTFTMAAEPSSAAHVWVSIGGILQDPSAYSVDGTDLIFTEAPPDGVSGSYRIVALSDGEEVPPDGSVTTAKLGALAVTRDKIGADAVGPDQLDEDAVTDTHIAAAAASGIRTKLGVHRAISFSANKNATDQTGIASATPTQVTFGTEEWDDGNYFASSAWTPPAGYYEIKASVFTTANIVDQAKHSLAIYKNGSLHKYLCEVAASGTAGLLINGNALVVANGTDVFTIWYSGSGAGNKTISGATNSTFFSGTAI